MAPRKIDLTSQKSSDLGQLLGLDSPRPVLVLIGGAAQLDPQPDERQHQPDLRTSISEFLTRVIAPAIRGKGIVVLTGGTSHGLMKLAGEALGEDCQLLVGVTPKSMVSGDKAEAKLDKKHDVAVLTNGDWWGAESETLFGLATAVTSGTAPGVVILANGGQVSIREADRFLAGGWPILPVGATGGAADDLIDAWRIEQSKTRTSTRLSWPRRKLLSQDFGPLADADIEILVPAQPDQARLQLDWRLDPNLVLKAAWARFAALDEASCAAKFQAKRTRRFLAGSAFLLMAIAAALVQLAVLRSTGDAPRAEDPAAQDGPVEYLLAVGRALLVALPVAIAVAAALGTRLGSDRAWVVSRQAAESLKAEIYRYRARLLTGKRRKADRRLAAVLRAVDVQLLREGVQTSALADRLVRGRPSGVDPDELAGLDARLYLKHRVDGQLNYFAQVHRAQARADVRIVAASALAAALASTLAGTRFAVWISFLILVAMFLYVQRLRAQTSEQLAGFDRATADLKAARIAWVARPNPESAHVGFEELVSEVEDALERQGRGWSANLSGAIRQVEVYGSNPMPGL